jgi:hypothetical protein
MYEDHGKSRSKTRQGPIKSNVADAEANATAQKKIWERMSGEAIPKRVRPNR